MANGQAVREPSLHLLSHADTVNQESYSFMLNPILTPDFLLL